MEEEFWEIKAGFVTDRPLAVLTHIFAVRDKMIRGHGGKRLAMCHDVQLIL